MENNDKVVSADMYCEFARLFIDEGIYLLGKHLDGLAGNVGTEETVELVKTFKTYESAGEEESVFRIKDLSHVDMEIIQVMKSRIRIDITHVAKEFLDPDESRAVTDAFAENGGLVVDVGIVFGSEVVAVKTHDHIYAVNAFDGFVNVIAV